MRVNFRQGIIHAQIGFLNYSTLGVTIQTSQDPTVVTIAHGMNNYLHHEPKDVLAWTAPFTTGQKYWLYWDFNPRTFARTFGKTTLVPIVAPTYPTTPPTPATPTTPAMGYDSEGVAIFPPAEGRHWFDTINNKMFVRQGSNWVEVIRVFAASLLNGSFSSVSMDSPSFFGTQIGNTTSINAGRVIFDEYSKPILKSNKSFFTSEDMFFSAGSRIDGCRLESNVDYVINTSTDTIPAYKVVAYTNFGEIAVATFEDVSNTTIACMTQTTYPGELGTVIIQGVVSNPAWNWTEVGKLLWVDNGELVAVNPYESAPALHPENKPPVARVLSHQSVVFDQGLGMKGDKGEPGSIGVIPHATTTVYGLVKLVTAEPNARAVSDTDPRLIDARVPLAHTHPASAITFAATGNISSTNVQLGMQELDSEKVAKDGDTMTGHLTLNADPTIALHAATKQYVDNRPLDSLSDVVITAPVLNHILKYDGVNWVNGTFSGVVQYLDDLLDVTITNPQNNQILRYSSYLGQWVNSNESAPSVNLNALTDVTITSAADQQVLKYDNSLGQWINTGMALVQLSDVTASSVNAATAGDLLVKGSDGYWKSTNTDNVDIHYKTLNHAALVNYSEVKQESAVSTTVHTIDLALGNTHELTLSSSITTFSITGATTPVPSEKRAFSITLIVKQDTVGGNLITWPSSFKWAGGVPPTQSTTPNAIDVYTIISTDKGVTWFAFVSGLNLT